MNVPFEYKHIHLQNTHVASIRRKKTFSWFTDNLLWHSPLFYSYLENLSGFLSTMTATSLFLCLLLNFS